NMFWALQFVTLPTPAPLNRIQYFYENASFPFALTGIADEKGVRYATWAFDASGRVTLSQHAGGADSYTFSYDDTANTTTVVNPLGKQTVYHFTKDARALNRLTQIEGVASARCAAANTSYAYDANGFVNQTTDGEGRVTAMVNDTRGSPLSITRGFGTPAAVTTTNTWHATFNVPTQTVQPGLTTDFTWNTAGQLAQVTQTDTTTQTVPYSTAGQTPPLAHPHTP